MRNKIVAANWKMNLTLAEGNSLVKEICDSVIGLSDSRSVVIAPPFIHVTQVAAAISSVAHIHTGAQNCYHEPAGAYTGEISASMLQSAGVGYVIIGHSERREYAAETNDMLAAKVNQALACGLKVIFCCGEQLAVRDADTQNAFVEEQLRAGIFHLTAQQMRDVTIAYEPIWAIGTGRTASTEQAQDMHAHIRSVVAASYGADVAAGVSVLYGGSCKPSNAAELFSCPDVDGGLIGGASLKSSEFLAIIAAMVNT